MRKINQRKKYFIHTGVHRNMRLKEVTKAAAFTPLDKIIIITIKLLKFEMTKKFGLGGSKLVRKEQDLFIQFLQL